MHSSSKTPPSYSPDIPLIPFSPERENTRCTLPPISDLFKRVDSIWGGENTLMDSRDYHAPIQQHLQGTGDKSRYRPHTSTLAGKNRFPCTVPGYEQTFASRSSIQNHIPGNKRRHACQTPGCGGIFFRAADLRRHYRAYKHTGEKLFACLETGCGMRCSNKSSLNRHSRGHQRKKKYSR